MDKNRKDFIRYSIRKYSFGVVSVSVATGFFFMSGVSVNAQGISTESTVEITTESGNNKAFESNKDNTNNNSSHLELDSTRNSETDTSGSNILSHNDENSSTSLNDNGVDEHKTDNSTVLSSDDNKPIEIGNKSENTETSVENKTENTGSDANIKIDSVVNDTTSNIDETITDTPSEETSVGISSIETRASNSNMTVKSLNPTVINALKSVTFEDLYSILNPYIRFTDKENIKNELKKKNNGVVPSSEELEVAVRKFYMDTLDMRHNFNTVHNDIESILGKIFEKSSNVDDNTVIENKNKILLGLTLLERQYNFSFGDISAKDLILFNPELINPNIVHDSLQNIIRIGTLTGSDAEMIKSHLTYTKNISSITNKNDIIDFINFGVTTFTNKNVSDWFKEESKAYIVETTSSNGNTSLYEKLSSDNTLKSHIIPLLTLSTDSIYAISTTNTISYGLVDTYIDRNNKDSMIQSFKTSLNDTAKHQQKFLDFWYRITNRKDAFRNYSTIVSIDTMQKYGSSKNDTAEQLWSAKYGENALIGVREFLTPLNLYTNYFRADGQASGNKIVYYLAKALTDRGKSTYSHEVTHVLDEKFWFDGNQRRTGKKAEVFARGLFESLNNATSGYSPIFNLNTIYTLDANRVQNASPERFQNDDDIKTYMSGLLDVIYTLDYAEALAILEKNGDDRSILLNKVSLINESGATNDNFEHISSEEASRLSDINDFIDNNIVSARLEFKGNETTGITKQNDYLVVPMFEPIYAALQNNSGATGDLTFKRNAYDILGEYGYTNGMSSYLSNQYSNDEQALASILDSKYNGNLSSFKKNMFKRRIDNIDNLKPTAQFNNFNELLEKMKVAINSDLEVMKLNKQQRDAQPNNVLRVGMATNANAVRNLKEEILKSYINSTNDFTNSIYNEIATSNIIYVRDGEETSTEGSGTDQNPYRSLSYALEKAKDGDIIKFVNNIVYRQQSANETFKINKNVTIDGQGNTVTFRGSNLELKKNVTFDNITLNMIPDGRTTPKIYVSGNEVTFKNVSTLINQAQSDLRPTIIGSSLDGQNDNATHTKINIIGGSSETRFKKIIAGSDITDTYIPVTINIDSEFATVDEGILLGGENGSQITDKVTLISNSKNIRLVDGSNTIDSEVILKDHNFTSLNLQNILHLTLTDNAKLTTSNTNISGNLTVNNGSQLWVNTPDKIEVGNIKGTGNIVIKANSSLEVERNIEDSINIKISIFESELQNYINKKFIDVGGNINNNVTVSLSTNNSDYFIERSNTSNEYILKKVLVPSPTTREEKIDYRIIYIADDTKDLGYLSETGGERGIKTYTTTYTRNQDGDIISSEDSGVVTKRPIDKIITKGTKPTLKIEVINLSDLDVTTVNDSSIPEGTTIETPGENGEKTFTDRYVLDENGNITKIEDSVGVITKQKKNKIIKIGTGRNTVTPRNTVYRSDNSKEFGFVEITDEGEDRVVDVQGQVISDGRDRVITKGTKSKIENINPVTKNTIYVADDISPNVPGTKISETEGSDGYTVRTTRYTMDSSGTITETISENIVRPVDKVITISTRSTVRVETIRLMDSDVTTINDPSILDGRSVEIAGEDGEKTFTDRYILDRDGSITKIEDTVGVVTKEKKNKIIRIGTGRSNPSSGSGSGYAPDNISDGKSENTGGNSKSNNNANNVNNGNNSVSNTNNKNNANNSENNIVNKNNVNNSSSNTDNKNSINNRLGNSDNKISINKNPSNTNDKNSANNNLNNVNGKNDNINNYTSESGSSSIGAIVENNNSLKVASTRNESDKIVEDKNNGNNSIDKQNQTFQDSKKSIIVVLLAATLFFILFLIKRRKKSDENK